MSDTDMTGGQYRRVYSGYLRSRKMNCISVEAEAMFIRLLVIADDYGGFHAEDDVIGSDVFLRRPELVGRAVDLLGELEEVGLVECYTVEGERYGSICGFVDKQPAGRNGKRVRKIPAIQVNLGESKINQDGPEIPDTTITNTITNTNTSTNTTSRIEEGCTQKQAAKLHIDWQAGSSGNPSHVRHLVNKTLVNLADGQPDALSLILKRASSWSEYIQSKGYEKRLDTWLTDCDWMKEPPEAKGGSKIVDPTELE